MGIDAHKTIHKLHQNYLTNQQWKPDRLQILLGFFSR